MEVPPRYMDEFSKHAIDTGKTDSVQIMLIPKDSITPLYDKWYTVYLKHNVSLMRKLTDLEKAGIIHPSTSNFASPIIIIQKKRDPSTHEITYRMVVGFMKMNEQLEY